MAVPDLVVPAVKKHLAVLPLGCARVHWHPAKRVANAVGFTPGQALFAKLLSAGDVFLSDNLKRLAVQSQQFPSTFGVRV